MKRANKKLSTYKDWKKREVEADRNLFSSSEWAKVKDEQKALFENEVEKKFQEYLNVFHELLSKVQLREVFLKEVTHDLEDIFQEGFEQRATSPDYSFFKNPVFDDIHFDILTVFGVNSKLQLIKRGHSNDDYSIVKYSKMPYNLEDSKELRIAIYSLALIRFKKFFDDFQMSERSLQGTLISKEKTQLPDFLDLFIRKDYSEYVIKQLEGKYIDFNRIEGKYYWKGSKTELVSLVYQLHYFHKLNKFAYSGNPQNLRKIACSYFHVNIGERTFRPSYYEEHKVNFPFIRDFN